MSSGQNVFSVEIRRLPGFARAYQLWLNSPSFRSLLAHSNVTVIINQNDSAPTGPTKSRDGSVVIGVNRAEIVTALSSGNDLQFLLYGDRVAHEYAHGVLTGGLPPIAPQNSPYKYFQDEMSSEVVAYTTQFRIAKELSIDMSTTDNAIYNALDGYLSASGGQYNQSFLSSSSTWLKQYLPSKAVAGSGITYYQYDRYSYALGTAGIDVSKVNWNTVTDANFTITGSGSNGWSLVANNIQMLDGNTISVTGGVRVDAGYTALCSFTETYTVNGVTHHATANRCYTGNGLVTPISSDPGLVRTIAFESQADSSGNVTVGFSDGSTETWHVQPSEAEQALQGFAQTFGSTLGRLVGGSNLVIETAAGSVLSEAALSIGKSIFPGFAFHQAPGTVGANVSTGGTIWSDFQYELGQFGTSASIGSVSSYLSTELAQAIGFQGFAGQAFSAVTGDVLQYYATRAIAGTSIGETLGISSSGSLGGALKSGIAGFIGTELASLVVTPHTTAEATLASLGSAIGAIGIGSLGSTIAAGIATSIAASGGSFSTVLAVSSLGGPVGAAIGAFVGFILGDLIGSLFGHHKPRVPTASAETVLQIPLARYAIGIETAANGGDLALADAMAKAARDTLNGIIAQITGPLTGGQTPSYVSNSYSPTQVYGVNGNQIYVKLGGAYAGQTNVASADQAVDQGVLWALPQTQIVGGDIYLKRALRNGQWTSVTALLGDLQIASDYEQYVRNEPVIDAAIASSWNSLAQGDKDFYSANQAFMTRAISMTQLPLTGGDVGFYQANQAQVDRIIGSISVSSFAAGWIVTLARAAELKLGDYSPSDWKRRSHRKATRSRHRAHVRRGWSASRPMRSSISSAGWCSRCGWR